MCSSSDHFYTDGQLFYPVTGLQMKRTSVTRTAHHRYKYCIGVVFYSTVQYSNRQGGCSRQFFPFISVRICLHSDGGGFVVLFFALYIRIFLYILDFFSDFKRVQYKTRKLVIFYENESDFHWSLTDSMSTESRTPHIPRKLVSCKFSVFFINEFLTYSMSR